MELNTGLVHSHKGTLEDKGFFSRSAILEVYSWGRKNVNEIKLEGKINTYNCYDRPADICLKTQLWELYESQTHLY